MENVPGYEGVYKVTSDGRVYHYYKHREPKELTYGESFDGYIQVRLWDRNLGKMKYWRVHRLVATTFIPNPDNLPEVNHKDGNKQNNNVENLEWCTHSENIKHAYDIGLLQSSNVRRVKSIDKEGNEREFESIAECGRQLGICASNINTCCQGYRKTARGYRFEYL